MSLDGLSAGQSVKLTITDPSGVKKFELLRSFKSKQVSNIESRVYIDGRTRHPKFYKGWEGTFEFDRGSSAIDDYFNQQESAYYLGGDQINCTITQTITEINGSTSQYVFSDVVLNYDDAGTASGEEVITQSVSFECSRRQAL